jgi:hypothetical protein
VTRITGIIAVSLASVGCQSDSNVPPQFIEGPGTIHTQSYAMNVHHPCAEGCVSCDKIRLVLLDKRTSDVLTAVGATWHTIGSDGVTPSRFLGYRFTCGDRTYELLDDVFRVVDGGNAVLVEEPIDRGGS